MEAVKGGISGIPIRILQGDITERKYDAYVVPEFSTAISEGGVGGAVMMAGAEQGMLAYGDYLEKHDGVLPFGEACITTSGGGNSKYLIHVSSVGSGRNNEFATVQKAMYNALSVAVKRGIKTIAVPALGTGIIGSLTPAQSAKAMMSAVNEFAKSDKSLYEVNFVIYASENIVNQFGDVLKTKSYQDVSQEPGQKEFDLGKWVSEMQRNIGARSAFRNRN